ncbi:MAG: DUF378 domain-containing protein [Chlamydiota bacterium]
MHDKRIINSIALVILIISGLNWGSVSLFNYDFVSGLCGCQSGFIRFIYFIFGLAGLYACFVMMKVKSKRK